MADITIAADEQTTDAMVDAAVMSIPATATSGSGDMGPFPATYSGSVSFAPGNVDLIAPGTIRLADFRANWSVNMTIQVDLGDFLPEFCLPRVCINLPWFGQACTPEICVGWPTIVVPFALSDFVMVTADMGLDVSLVGSDWRVEAVVQGVPNLQFGLTTAVVLAAVGGGLALALLAVPLAGPFLALLTSAVFAAIGVAGITGLLGPIITPIVSGMRLRLWDQPQAFTAVPAAPIPGTSATDPDVVLTLEDVAVHIESSDEDELVLEIEIS